MKVLLVEDDEIKRIQLDAFLHEALPDSEVSLAKSYHSALQSVIGGAYDLIILDMTMPTYDIGAEEYGGRPQHYAGRDILRQLERRSIKTPVVVVTQFDVFGEGISALTRAQLDVQLRTKHSGNYIGTVYYNSATDGWKTDLKSALDSVLRKHK